MTDTYYTTPQQRHWYAWPVVIAAGTVLWIMLGLCLVAWSLWDRIAGD